MANTKIDLETERRQAELIAAATQPASVYFAQNKALTGPTDTITKATSVDGANRRISRPELDKPKDLGLDTFIDGRDGMKNLMRATESNEPIDIDNLVNEMMMAFVENRNDFLRIRKEYFDIERQYEDTKEKERSDEMRKQVVTSKHVRTWDMAEKSLVSLGLIAAGIAGIATGGFVPLGVAAVVVGTLMLVDQLLEDKAKKAVASWMARGNQELEQAWLDRIQLFCAMTSVGLSLGLAAPAAIQIGIGVSRAVAGGVRGALELRRNFQHATIAEFDAVCTVAQKSVNRLIFEIQEICNTLYQLYENMHHIDEKLKDLVRIMLRLPNMN